MNLVALESGHGWVKQNKEGNLVMADPEDPGAMRVTAVEHMLGSSPAVRLTIEVECQLVDLAVSPNGGKIAVWH